MTKKELHEFKQRRAEMLYAGKINPVVGSFPIDSPPKIQPMTPSEFKKWRCKHWKRQVEAAKFIGVTSQTIHHWETGKSRMPWMLWYVVAAIETGITAQEKA